MSVLTFPNTFTPNTLIRSTLVNENFTTIKTLINTTGLDNDNIKTGANIARAKLAAGTANHVVINDASGTFSSEATLAVSRGGTNASAFTAGSVIFAGASGTSLTQDNSNLFWDDTNNRLGIGTASPSNSLHVKQSATAFPALFESTSATALIKFIDVGTANSPQIGSSGDSIIFKTGAASTTRLTVADALITSSVTLQTTQAVVTGMGAGAVISSSGGVLSNETSLNPARGGTGLTGYVAGDLIYASAGTTLSRLAVGSANTVLVTDGSVPSWATIVNANVSSTAGIARTKLAAGTANHVVINDASGTFSSEATLAVSRGGTNASSWTAGSVVFAGASGTSLTQDNSNLFWDDSNNRLGIGTTSPSQPLHIRTSSVTPAIVESTGVSSGIKFQDAATTNTPTVGCVGDNILVKTGASSTTRLSVCDNGTSSFATDLGINVSPSFQLQAQNGSGATYNGSTQSGFNRQLAVGTTSNATNRNSCIWLYQGANNASCYLTGVQNSGGGGEFTIANTNTAGTIAETLRCTSEGLVGIKTSTPSATLHVVGSMVVSAAVTFSSTAHVAGAVSLATTVYVGGSTTFNSDITLISGGASFQPFPHKGVTDASDATSGYVGQTTFAQVTAAGAVTLATGTNVTITSLTLTAGDWVLSCLGMNTGVTTGTVLTVAIATATNSLTGVTFGHNGIQSPATSTAAADSGLSIPHWRVSISGSTSYYLVMSTTHTVGTSKGYGTISAVRVR